MKRKRSRLAVQLILATSIGAVTLLGLFSWTMIDGNDEFPPSATNPSGPDGSKFTTTTTRSEVVAGSPATTSPVSAAPDVPGTPTGFDPLRCEHILVSYAKLNLRRSSPTLDPEIQRIRTFCERRRKYDHDLERVNRVFNGALDNNRPEFTRHFGSWWWADPLPEGQTDKKIDDSATPLLPSCDLCDVECLTNNTKIANSIPTTRQKPVLQTEANNETRVNVTLLSAAEKKEFLIRRQEERKAVISRQQAVINKIAWSGAPVSEWGPMALDNLIAEQLGLYSDEGITIHHHAEMFACASRENATNPENRTGRENFNNPSGVWLHINRHNITRLRGVPDKYGQVKRFMRFIKKTILSHPPIQEPLVAYFTLDEVPCSPKLPFFSLLGKRGFKNFLIPDSSSIGHTPTTLADLEVSTGGEGAPRVGLTNRIPNATALRQEDGPWFRFHEVLWRAGLNIPPSQRHHPNTISGSSSSSVPCAAAEALKEGKLSEVDLQISRKAREVKEFLTEEVIQSYMIRLLTRYSSLQKYWVAEDPIEFLRGLAHTVKRKYTFPSLQAIMQDQDRTRADHWLKRRGAYILQCRDDKIMAN